MILADNGDAASLVPVFDAFLILVPWVECSLSANYGHTILAIVRLMELYESGLFPLACCPAWCCMPIARIIIMLDRSWP